MEVDCKSEDVLKPDGLAEDQLESSTTDDSSGVYQYYPHVDFMNVGSTHKVRSCLGRRRRTINPFRLAPAYITEESNEINHSESSTEDSSSIASRETSTCPSFFEKTESSHKNVKNSVVSDQENRPVLSSVENIERHGFRNVSNTMNKAPWLLSQEKLVIDDRNKIGNIQDNSDPFLNPKIDLNQRNPSFNSNQNQSHRMALKQNMENIFLSNPTKMNLDHNDQINTGKALVEPKLGANAGKENILNSRELFSSSFQNNKNSINALKKFESQNYFRFKPTESHSSFKGLHKAASLDDLPLDLKLKFKSERASNVNIFGTSNEKCRSNLNDFNKENYFDKEHDLNKGNDCNKPMKLNLNVDSQDFINIFDMPSVKRNPEFDSPRKSIHSSLMNLSSSSKNLEYLFKEPGVPFPRNQQSDLFLQEPSDSNNCSVLNLSIDTSSKTDAKQTNNSVLGMKVSPKNFFSSDSNVPSSVRSENGHQRTNRNESLIYNSGSDNSNSSVSLNLSTKNTVLEHGKQGNKTQQGSKVCRSNSPTNSNVPANASPPSTFHRNLNPVPPLMSKSTANTHLYSESCIDLQRNGRSVDTEKQSMESNILFGKNFSAAYTNVENGIGGSKNLATGDSQRKPHCSSISTKSVNADDEKNICSFGLNKQNLAITNPVLNKPAQQSKPLPFDTRALAQEIFKKPSEPIPPMKTVHAPDSFKKPIPPVSVIGAGSGISVAVSQGSINNSNFVLPKLNARPSKSTYSFASDVAKFCQKDIGKDMKLSSLKHPPSNTQSIRINNKAYQILSSLGRGGSSEVYQVLDPTNKALLAVKCVKLASVDESIAEGYMNEVKLLEKLQDCSCVIRMFDYEYFKESKKLFVVMEKGDTDLSRLLKDINKTKKISMSMIIYYWTEMLTAVREIHEKGIIHSDLKPANFLLVSGRLKLIDFGIASSLQGDMTSIHKDICAGTENYMSPEAIQDGTGGHDKKFKISCKSDVWSLGCILYNLLYGKTPFSHIPSRFGKMYAIISPNHKIDFPDHPMPPVLRSALQSCLIRDPKQRPAVKELLDLPYHAATLPKDLALKIQQSIHEECWLKIAHHFSETMKKTEPSRFQHK